MKNWTQSHPKFPNFSGKAWFGGSPEQTSTNTVSQRSTSIKFNHSPLIPWSWGYKCLCILANKGLSSYTDFINWRGSLFFFFHLFFFSSERRDIARASQKWETLFKLPRKPAGSWTLPDRARASPDLMLGSIGMPGVWDSGGAQA